MANRVAFAIGAHPDDIELLMAGTLLHLGEAGYDLHVMHVANGSCGSMTEEPATIAARREQEARVAADVLGAAYHPPIANDIGIFYEPGLLKRLASIVREVEPTVMLIHAPSDYMEDHTNSCRLAVTAAFVRGMPNYRPEPPSPPTQQQVTLYHAMPWGLRDPLRNPIYPEYFVDIGATVDRKREALACHASQKEWLDATQGLDSYLDAMTETAREVGAVSGQFKYAEGWRRHLHLGFCDENTDPLKDALGETLLHSSREEEIHGH